VIRESEADLGPIYVTRGKGKSIVVFSEVGKKEARIKNARTR